MLLSRLVLGLLACLVLNEQLRKAMHFAMVPFNIDQTIEHHLNQFLIIGFIQINVFYWG